jgi:hypothetical protein
MTHQVTRDESAEVGYHYRLDLADGAVEVDAFRLHHQGELFLEVFGSRGSDSQPDSVVVVLPVGSPIYSLAQALTRGNNFLDRTRKDRERRGPK